MQPVQADDLAAAIAQILRQSQKPYPVVRTGPPARLLLRRAIANLARIAGMRPVLMRMPFLLWDVFGRSCRNAATAAAHAQLGRTYENRYHGLQKPAKVYGIGNPPRLLEDEVEAILNQSKQKALLP